MREDEQTEKRYLRLLAAPFTEPLGGLPPLCPEHNEGTPIPEDQQAALFEPFTRAVGAGAGWGLGLTLVRGVAESHGGSVGFDSSPGRGTTFTLWLPRAVGPVPRAA